MHEILAAELGKLFRAEIGPSSPGERGDRAKRNVAVHCEKARRLVSSFFLVDWLLFHRKEQNLDDRNPVTILIPDPCEIPVAILIEGIKDKIASVGDLAGIGEDQKLLLRSCTA